MNQTQKITDPRPMYGIYRPKPKPEYWLVRLALINGVHTRYFSFKSLGGKDAALNEAIKYRDSLIHLCKFRTQRARQKGTIRDHAPEELVNITRQHPDSKCPGWRVTIRYQCKNETKNFRDSQYGGYEGSLKAAQQYRDWLRSLLPGK